MPAAPTPANTRDRIAPQSDDAGAERDGIAAPPTPPMQDETPDVGLSQKGLGEDATVRRETDI